MFSERHSESVREVQEKNLYRNSFSDIFETGRKTNWGGREDSHWQKLGQNARKGLSARGYIKSTVVLWSRVIVFNGVFPWSLHFTMGKNYNHHRIPVSYPRDIGEDKARSFWAGSEERRPTGGATHAFKDVFHRHALYSMKHKISPILPNTWGTPRPQGFPPEQNSGSGTGRLKMNQPG